MNEIKMYVIRDAKYPQWYFQHIKDYSSMMGYLAKNHPRYTHKFTTDIIRINLQLTLNKRCILKRQMKF